MGTIRTSSALNVTVSAMFKKLSPVPASAALYVSVQVPAPITPTLTAFSFNSMRSFSAKAVSVGLPVHVISVGVVLVNSTPSEYNPPPSSVSTPRESRLNKR